MMSDDTVRAFELTFTNGRKETSFGLDESEAITRYRLNNGDYYSMIRSVTEVEAAA